MQTILIYLIIAVAVFYMARRIYKSVTHKGQAGCEHCSGSEMSSAKHTKVTSGK